MSRRHPKDLILYGLAVTDAAARGKAVAHAEDGRAVLIEGAVPGDTVDVRVTKKSSRYYEGRVERLLTLSEKRTEPPCPHFGVCGGCRWQNMQYRWQLYYKQQEVENNLRRIGGVELPPISPILGCEHEYYYRNKLEFSFACRRWYTREELDAAGEISSPEPALGFHIQGRWDKVLDVRKCLLQPDPSNAIRDEIKRYALEKGLDFFDPRTNQGLLRTLMLRISQTTGEVMLLVQFGREDRPAREGLLDHLLERFPQITSLLYAINEKVNDSVYDLDIRTYRGSDHITERMEDLVFRIGPKSFFQTNTPQALRLYRVVRDFAGLTGSESVYDLYTGTGTISQFVSRRAGKVVGVESVAEAIDAARENACVVRCGNRPSARRTPRQPRRKPRKCRPQRDRQLPVPGGRHERRVRRCLRGPLRPPGRGDHRSAARWHAQGRGGATAAPGPAPHRVRKLQPGHPSARSGADGCLVPRGKNSTGGHVPPNVPCRKCRTFVPKGIAPDRDTRITELFR